MSRNDAMREARLRMGLSQQALAEQLGVSRQTIIAIESGDYNPTIRLCVGICRALGVTLNDLFWNSELFEKN
jgi:putative transcriptional regulator